MRKLVFVLSIFCGIPGAFAQVVSPSAQEISFEIESQVEGFGEPRELAEAQVNYLFGKWTSPEHIRKLGLSTDKVLGLGAPQKSLRIQVLNSAPDAGGRLKVTYRARGLALLHKQYAARVLREKAIDLALPLRPLEIYDPKCTDEHYNSQGDFWYFYNPFRRGCTYLLTEPFSTKALMKASSGPVSPIEKGPRLDLLRGDNLNGELFQIDVIHGYYSDPRSRKDEGRLAFEAYNEWLREWGFSETIRRENTTYPIHVFEGSIDLNSGKSLQVRIRHLLVETSAETKNVTFAKFFRDSLLNSDVVVYAGHSGLGANLDLDLIEAKAGPINFKPGKRQILFFESCSSYSYYLDHFRQRVHDGRVDIITHGLSSYFETGPLLLDEFTRFLLSEEVDGVLSQQKWLDVLKALEVPLNGESYLTNVGAL